MTKEEVENSVNTSEVEHTDKDILRDEDKGPEKDAKKEDTKSSSENELASLKDRLARAYAEIENQRRRFEKEKEEAYEYGGFAFAKEALNLLDNLERSKASLENDESLKDEGSLKKIIEHIDIINKDMISIFSKNNINPIKAINKKLDPNFHQAMMEIEDDEKDPGTIVQEIQKGFTIKDRLLRPSLVAVSKKKENKNEKSEENKEKKDKN